MRFAGSDAVVMQVGLGSRTMPAEDSLAKTANLDTQIADEFQRFLGTKKALTGELRLLLPELHVQMMQMETLRRTSPAFLSSSLTPWMYF